MNERAKTVSLIVDMLQRAGYREVRLVYTFLRAMLGEEEQIERSTTQ